MKKILLSICMALLGLTSYSQEIHRYDVKSGKYVQTVDMFGMKVSSTTYFDDYGTKELMEMEVFGRSVKSLLLDGVRYTIMGEEYEINPKKDDNITCFADLTPEKREEYKVKEIGDEEIAGKLCRVLLASIPTEGGIEVQNKLWVWEGIIMRSDVTTMGVTVSQAIVEIEIGSLYDPSFFSLPVIEHDWVSLGEGAFLDQFIWEVAGYPSSTPVQVEIFEDQTHPGQYLIQNPYAVAAATFGIPMQPQEDYFLFSIEGAHHQVEYSWVDVGIALSEQSEQIWGMFSGNKASSRNAFFNHVVSCLPDGAPGVIQLAPLYRTQDENHKGAVADQSNEIRKDTENGVAFIAFPGAQILPFIKLAESQVTVSANQMRENYNPEDDGWGALGLIDNNVKTFWHTPWTFVDEHPSDVYGQYVDISLPKAVKSFYFNYCTRFSLVQNGAPVHVVIGGSNNGKKYKVLAEFSLEQMEDLGRTYKWIGLPLVNCNKGYKYLRFGIVENKHGDDLRIVTPKQDGKWVNLSELHLYAQ